MPAIDFHEPNSPEPGDLESLRTPGTETGPLFLRHLSGAPTITPQKVKPPRAKDVVPGISISGEDIDADGPSFGDVKPQDTSALGDNVDQDSVRESNDRAETAADLKKVSETDRPDLPAVMELAIVRENTRWQPPTFGEYVPPIVASDDRRSLPGEAKPPVGPHEHARGGNPAEGIDKIDERRPPVGEEMGDHADGGADDPHSPRPDDQPDASEEDLGYDESAADGPAMDDHDGVSPYGAEPLSILATAPADNSSLPQDEIARHLRRVAIGFDRAEQQVEPIRSPRIDDDAQPEAQPLGATDRSSEDAGVSDGGPKPETHGLPPTNGVDPQDAHEAAGDQGPPIADRPLPPPSRHPAEPPSLLDLAREHMRKDDREFIKEQLKKLASKDEKQQQDAARKIRIRAATVIANAIASDVTEKNRWNAYRQDPYAFLGGSPPGQAPTSLKEKERRTFAERFLDAMEELIAVVVKEVLIELAMPGAHVILPPTGFFDAIFTAGALLEAADHAH